MPIFQGRNKNIYEPFTYYSESWLAAIKNDKIPARPISVANPEIID